MHESIKSESRSFEHIGCFFFANLNYLNYVLHQITLTKYQDCTSALHNLLTDEKLNPILWISAASIGGLLVGDLCNFPKSYFRLFYFQVINVLFSLSLCVVIDYAEYFYKY